MNDCFEFKGYNTNDIQEVITKRTVLSLIAKTFDPLGWISPIVITLKIFMQKLWLSGLNWDDELTVELMKEWCQYEDSLRNLEKFKIPRWISYEEDMHIELHAFSDASELAYAAVIYSRVEYPSGHIKTSLITSKTRVAPIKQLSLPRLELCGAHLLSKLVTKVKSALGVKHVTVHAWCDSTVVLAWLSDHPGRWKSFVANRTSQIISEIPSSQWRHVASKNNPADLATRGVSSNDLLHNNLWWHGPTLLQEFNSNADYTPSVNKTNLEERKNIFCNIEHHESTLFDRYSDFTKLMRITAYLLRFNHNCTSPQSRQTGFLTTAELEKGLKVLIIKSQQDEFRTEIASLICTSQLPSKNKLTNLAPFIDSDGIMRVGGRLQHAEISFEQKHPIILGNHHALTKLIINYYHQKHLHVGRRALSYLLALKYWIWSAELAIKRCIFKCTRCMRFRGKPFQQQMGIIPYHRLQPGVTFNNTGIDFAGPVSVKSWKGRGAKIYKSWIAVFVCLTTKAIHIDLVTELTTQAFIACLRRFVARRGKPQNIYSDNGTNFIGAHKHLSDVLKLLKNKTAQDAIVRTLAEQQIQWHFSPPSGPHFGGMWEAGVKSIKHHLRRVLSNTSTTFEEMQTVLCQIEACLNSRPLCNKLKDEVDPLTPAHFLIMRPMTMVIEEDTTNRKETCLNRWQYLQRLVQQYWKRWSVEYISQLQQRPKWKKKSKNLCKNDIVLIKDDNLPPANWSIGKIIALHPGTDALVSVVTIRTAKGEIKRPIAKLCPLFIDL